MEDNICRICMSKSDDVMILLFDYENGTSGTINEVGNMFSKCLQLELIPQTGYSEFICHYCKLQLSVFYNFMIMAKKSHEKFTQKLVNVDEIKFEVINEEESIPLEIDDIEHEQSIDDNDVEYPIEYLDDDKDIAESFLMSIKKEEEDFYLSEDEPLAYLIDENMAGTFKIGFDDRDFTSDNCKVIEKHIFNCKDCEQEFTTKTELKKHRQFSHPVSKFECELCDKKFKIYAMFESHMNIHNNLPAFQCSECQKTFNYKSNFLNHMKGHTNERPYPCNLCEKSFRTKWDLIIHIRVHKDIRKYACDVCNKRFRVHSHMKNHQYTHYEKQFECDLCLQKYTNPRTLKQHKNTVHSNIFPYHCEWCNKRFKRKHHVVNHMKIHNKIDSHENT